MREYGRERLDRDEADGLRRRYGGWAARLAEEVGAISQMDTATWYARAEREFLHLQAAFTAAVRHRDAATALRIAAGPGWAFIIIGRFHRLREWLHQALDLAREVTVDDRIMAQGLLMAGAVAGIDHRFDGTLDLLAEAQHRFETAGSVEGSHWTGYWRAANLAELGELVGALDVIDRTATSAAGHGLGVIEANARAEQAELLVADALARGGPDRDTRARTARALTRAGELASSHGMEEVSARVGMSEVLLTALGGEPAAALADAGRQLDAWRALGRGNRLIVGLVVTTKVALLAGAPREARPFVREALELIGEFAWSGPLRGAAQVTAVLAARREPAAAATLLGAADARPATHRWRMPIDLHETHTRLRGALGPDAFRATFDEGRTRSLDEVVTLGLDATSTLPD